MLMYISTNIMSVCHFVCVFNIDIYKCQPNTNCSADYIIVFSNTSFDRLKTNLDFLRKENENYKFECQNKLKVDL